MCEFWNKWGYREESKELSKMPKWMNPQLYREQKSKRERSKIMKPGWVSKEEKNEEHNREGEW